MPRKTPAAKKTTPMFEREIRTKDDVRAARVELLREAANSNPFGTNIVSSGQASLCAQLLNEIEHSLPSPVKRR